MRKKHLIITILIIIIVFVLGLLVVWRRGGSGLSPEQTSEQDLSPEVITQENGTHLLQYPAEGVSLSIPDSWHGVYFRTLDKGVKVFFSPDTSTYLEGWIDYATDSSQISFEEFKTLYSNYSIETSVVGKNELLQYFGQLPEAYFDMGGESGPDDLESLREGVKNSYSVGEIIKGDAYTLWIGCQIHGLNYGSLISDCNKFVESLSVE